MAEWVDISFGLPNVDGWLNTLNSYAHSAIVNAGNAAGGLRNFTPEFYYPNVTLDTIDFNLPGIDTLDKPTAPTVNITQRSLPSPVTLTAPILTIGTAPIFEIADPQINLPTVPAPLDIDAPVKDFTITTDFPYPDEPDTTLPDVPTLLDLNIPTMLDLDIPIFSIDFPSSSDLVPPGLTFDFQEDLYSSALLTKVTDALFTRLDGGTGLSAEVEEAIWNRGRDREQRASLLAERTLLIDRASQGFTRPSGSTQAALNQIVQETQAKLIELSREIMIKQAELEQENVKTSIQQVIALEDILIRNHNNVVQRAFEAAKYVQDVQIEIFKALAAKFQMEVEAYKAYASAFESRVRAELSKVEIFKAQIEAEKLKGDMNEQNIRIYVAKIEGIKSAVAIYTSLVEAIGQKIKAESLKLENFKLDIEAYAEQVKAKASEYEMYGEQMKGEAIKADVFDSLVKAFVSKVEAYSKSSDVSIKKAEFELSTQKLILEKYGLDIEAVIKQIQADTAIAQASIDVFRGEVAMYVAEGDILKTQNDIKLKEADAILQQNKFTADIAIQNAQIALESVKAAYLATLEGLKASGSIYQSIGSSALSAINVSAQVQGQAGLSLNENHNYSHEA